MFTKYSRCIRFITLIIPLFLVCVGMKVPGFSRTHKPKPIRRAILGKTSARTVVQSVEKIDLDPVITNPPTLFFLSTEEHSPEAPSIHSSVSLLALSSLPPRGPPASNPLALEKLSLIS